MLRECCYDGQADNGKSHFNNTLQTLYFGFQLFDFSPQFELVFAHDSLMSPRLSGCARNRNRLRTHRIPDRLQWEGAQVPAFWKRIG